MRILAIETSCDETSAAVIEKKQQSPARVLSVSISSSGELHALTGGIIPEKAAREQLSYIIPVITKSLLESEGKHVSNLKDSLAMGNSILQQSIDALAVTQGPGLIGSLLIGVETAKTLSFTMDKPIVPVNHLLAHIYANFIDQEILLPFIGLIVSGGHTDLLYFKGHGNYQWLGGTRDDAAGEALDKIGRILGLPYPAGPEIEKQASKATEKQISFSRPLINSQDFDFSFSGLKTEVARFIKSAGPLSEKDIQEISFAVQDAVIDVLVTKTLRAAEKYNCSTIVLGGGVSANGTLRDTMKQKAKNTSINPNIYYPKKKYTTDNAAMIGAYAAYNFTPVAWQDIKAMPELYFA